MVFSQRPNSQSNPQPKRTTSITNGTSPVRSIGQFQSLQSARLCQQPYDGISDVLFMTQIDFSTRIFRRGFFDADFSTRIVQSPTSAWLRSKLHDQQWGFISCYLRVSMLFRGNSAFGWIWEAVSCFRLIMVSTVDLWTDRHWHVICFRSHVIITVLGKTLLAFTRIHWTASNSILRGRLAGCIHIADTSVFGGGISRWPLGTATN